MLDWDLKAEQGGISEDDNIKREGWLSEIFQLEHMEKMDLFQKLCSKWVVEGDENTRYFHGIVNQRWRRNKIKGIIFEGVWISDPPSICSAFVNHFAKRFKEPRPVRPRFYCLIFSICLL